MARIKDSFLSNFKLAMRIAASEDIQHHMKSDEVAVKLLLQLAVHTSYHLGQVNLLKRELRLASKLIPDGI